MAMFWGPGIFHRSLHTWMKSILRITSLPNGLGFPSFVVNPSFFSDLSTIASFPGVVSCRGSLSKPGALYFTCRLIKGLDILIADLTVSSLTDTKSSLLVNVSISLGKSLICDTGCFEFAKKFFVTCDGQKMNLSPVSLACFGSINSGSLSA